MARTAGILKTQEQFLTVWPGKVSILKMQEPFYGMSLYLKIKNILKTKYMKAALVERLTISFLFFNPLFNLLIENVHGHRTKL